jgi:hypothetical protein
LYLVKVNQSHFSKETQSPKKIENSNNISNYFSTPVKFNLEQEMKISSKPRNTEQFQSKMLKEIEEYIEQNMNDMYKAIEEIKVSFEDEIFAMDGKIYLNLK